mmetsp:Transcript_13029/g.13088  ORF Transcript_13029/g.13088 Transcript_13029/m.13088 type:complete len:312 (-) Transcript_13029:159-1094(-)
MNLIFIFICSLFLGIEGNQHPRLSFSIEDSIRENCKNMSLSSPTQISFMACILCRSSTVTDIKSPNRFLRGMSIQSNSSIKPSTEDEFSYIYANQKWGRDGGGSGGGSDPEKARGTITILRTILYKYGVTRLLDAPCGAVSHSWMSLTLNHLHSDMSCFRYHGVDVVPMVIERNKDAFKDQSWASFTQMDLSNQKSSLPIGYDMILSRDALQHLPYHLIAGALDAYCRSDALYLLVGSYVGLKHNKDIGKAGGYFSINLLTPPFSFSSPVEIYSERGSSHETKSKNLLLYRLSDLCVSEELKQFLSDYIEK